MHKTKFLVCLNFIWFVCGSWWLEGVRKKRRRMIIVIKSRYGKRSGCSIMMNIICVFRARLLPIWIFIFILFFKRNYFLFVAAHFSAHFPVNLLFRGFLIGIGVLLSTSPARNVISLSYGFTFDANWITLTEVKAFLCIIKWRAFAVVEF